MKLAEVVQDSPSQVAFGRASVSQVIYLLKSQSSIYLVLEPTKLKSSRTPTSATPGTRLRHRALLHRGGHAKSPGSWYTEPRRLHSSISKKGCLPAGRLAGPDTPRKI